MPSKRKSSEVSAPASRKSGRKKTPVSYKEIEEGDTKSTGSGKVNAKVSFCEATILSKRAKLPKKNDKGELVFSDHQEFRPNLTPKEVLQSGAFGGTYFREIYSSVTGIKYKPAEVIAPFPKDWFEGLNLKKDVFSQTYDQSRNKFGVSCGGDLDMWEQNGWMSSIDPYGWFQWYCHFYLGRRSTDDKRQISRGNQVMGPTGRWRNNLLNKVLYAVGSKKTPEQALADPKISPKVRQLLLHWAYQPTMTDLTRAEKKSAQ